VGAGAERPRAQPPLPPPPPPVIPRVPVRGTHVRAQDRGWEALVGESFGGRCLLNAPLVGGGRRSEGLEVVVA
jgi:hypothetical protein